MQLDISHVTPVVTWPCHPGGSFEADEGGARFLASRKGVATHLGGEGMRGIHDMADPRIPKVASQPVDAAKSTRPRRQRLRDGAAGAPGVGIDGVASGIAQGAGQLARLGGAAQQQDACHG